MNSEPTGSPVIATTLVQQLETLKHRRGAFPAQGHPIGRTREPHCGLEQPSIGQSVQSKGEITWTI